MLALMLLVALQLAFVSDVRLTPRFEIDELARPTFQLFEFLLPALLLLWLGTGARHLLTLRIRTEDLIFAGFVVWALCLAIAGGDALHSVSRAKDFVAAWILFAVLRDLAIDKSQLRQVVWAGLLIVAACSLLGMVQMSGAEFWVNSGPGRLLSTLNNWKALYDPFTGETKTADFAQGLYWFPQDFSYYLVVPLFIAITLTAQDRAALPVALLILIALLGTGSKAFYLVGFSLAAWVILSKVGRLTRQARFALTSLAALNVSILAGLLIDRHVALKLLGTFQWRVEQWIDTFRMVVDKPGVLLSGHGTTYLAESFSRFAYANPHNVALYFLVEYGVIGLLLFASFLWVNLAKLAADLRRAPEPFIGATRIAKGILIGLCVLLAMMAVDDFFVQTQMTALFFFYLGLARRLTSPDAALGHKQPI